MSSTTYATQQAVVAAAARPRAAAACGALVNGLWNGSVGMTMGSHLEFASDIATKRPARHLGAPPTS